MKKPPSGILLTKKHDEKASAHGKADKFIIYINTIFVKFI